MYRRGKGTVLRLFPRSPFAALAAANSSERGLATVSSLRMFTHGAKGRPDDWNPPKPYEHCGPSPTPSSLRQTLRLRQALRARSC